MKNIKRIALSLLLLPVSLNAATYEAPGPFKIDYITMSSADNFHFRIIHNSPAWHCSNGPKSPAWSYINEADSGSSGKISVLLAAYMAGKKVTLQTVGVDTPVGRMCHIIEFSIHD